MSKEKTADRNISHDNLQREEKLCELEILKQSVEENKKKADEYYDQLLRLRAEFDNYRKRTNSEKEALAHYSKEQILYNIVTIIDNFDKALDAASQKANPESLRKGMELIYKLLKDMVEKEGLKHIESEGCSFNPEFHHAVESRVTEEYEDGQIIEVLQKGYMLKDRIVRPAMVVVAKREDSSDQKQ